MHLSWWTYLIDGGWKEQQRAEGTGWAECWAFIVNFSPRLLCMLFIQVGVFIEGDRTSPISSQGHEKSYWWGNQHRRNVKDKDSESGEVIWQITHTNSKISAGQANTVIKHKLSKPLNCLCHSEQPCISYGQHLIFFFSRLSWCTMRQSVFLGYSYIFSNHFPFSVSFFFCLSVYAIWRLSVCIMCPRTCSWSALIACLFPSAAFVLLWRHLAWLDHLLMTTDRHTHCTG